MADPTQNYVPKAPAAAKMMQDSANDLSIASAVKGTEASSTLYTEFDDLIANCNNALINTAEGGTQGVDPASSGDFRGYPLPSIDMNYETVVTGTDPDEIIESFACLPTLNNKVGYEVKLRVDVLEFVGVPPGSPVYLEWIFTFDAGSTEPDSVTRDGSPASLTGGKYQLNVIYELSEANPDNISVIADYIFQSAFADIIFTSTDPESVTLHYTEAVTITLLTDFYKTTVSGCGQNPVTVLNYYSRAFTEVTDGDTLYSNAAATVLITDTLGSTNVVPAVAYDWFNVTSGVVGSFNACP